MSSLGISSCPRAISRERLEVELVVAMVLFVIFSSLTSRYTTLTSRGRNVGSWKIYLIYFE
jgi:hypothetical protein